LFTVEDLVFNPDFLDYFSSKKLSLTVGFRSPQFNWTTGKKLIKDELKVKGKPKSYRRDIENLFINLLAVNTSLKIDEGIINISQDNLIKLDIKVDKLDANLKLIEKGKISASVNSILSGLINELIDFTGQINLSSILNTENQNYALSSNINFKEVEIKAANKLVKSKGMPMELHYNHKINHYLESLNGGLNRFSLSSNNLLISSILAKLIERGVPGIKVEIKK
jgi:hypothetical protein